MPLNTVFAYIEAYDKRGPDVALKSSKEINPRAYKLLEERADQDKLFNKYGRLKNTVFLDRAETPSLHGGSVSISHSKKLRNDPSDYIE